MSDMCETGWYQKLLDYFEQCLLKSKNGGCTGDQIDQVKDTVKQEPYVV